MRLSTYEIILPLLDKNTARLTSLQRKTAKKFLRANLPNYRSQLQKDFSLEVTSRAKVNRKNLPI